MTRVKEVVALLTLALMGADAAAQSFAEGMESGSSDMVGPQGVRGRESRAQNHAQRDDAEEHADTESEENPNASEHWLDAERLSGDWWGRRTKLEDSGLTIESTLIAEWYSVLDGGVRSHSTSRMLMDLNITLDLEQMFNWDGASVFADAYWIDGNSVSADAGDFQGVSNIESDDRLQLSELWFEQVLFDNSLRIKLGKIEGNSEFAFVDAAGDFVNSSAGFSPTFLALPTFPDPSTGVVVSWNHDDRFSITGAVMDGSATVDGVRTGLVGPSTFFDDDRSDDYVWIGELNAMWDGGRAGVGGWYHDGQFSRFLGGTEDGTAGFYALVEHRVWSPGEDRGVDLFAQLGFADESVSDAAMHLAGGLNWTGPFASRSDDALGLYCSFVDLSEDAGYADDELVIELFYKLQLTPFMSIKPDLQYIINPSGDSTLDDALVLGFRAETTF